MGANILLVDDDPSIRSAELQALIEDGHTCTEAADAVEARERLKEQEFALALIDLGMPGPSGMELVRHVHYEHPNTACLIVTGDDDPEVAKLALSLGAYGYVIKPFKLNELLINVANALQRRELEFDNRSHLERLEHTVIERTASLHEAIEQLARAEKEIRSSQEETVIRLARAAEVRDDETGWHIQRMSSYCALLARKAGIAPDRCELIRLASIMHDVGKIGIPDHILLKPGPLTSYEFTVMKQHVDIGYRILLGSKSELLQMAATIAWTHHEKYDGSGYRRGLVGDAIPLEGRIAAIADVFDVLTTARVYKPAHPLEKALVIMREGRGKHFDPALLDLFLASIDEVVAIRARYGDSAARAVFSPSRVGANPTMAAAV